LNKGREAARVVQRSEAGKQKTFVPHLFFTPVHARVHLAFLLLDGVWGYIGITALGEWQ